MSVRDLDYLFKPASIALIGASKRPGSVGAVLARNLFAGGFDGPIMPVNPHHTAIGGSLAWPDIASLPMTPDLAVVATPADAVPGVVADLRDKGCRAVCVITAGFGEGGDAEGEARRAALLEAAGPMRVLGPNVLGLMVPGMGLNASFAHRDPLPGDLAFIAQSGAMLTSVLDWATGRGIGFSHLVSLGDKIDVDFGDMLNYLATDPKVRAILLYIEAIGDAAKFMSAARAAARTKPVVAIKAGRVAEGAKAASSHTGALAGSDAVYDAAFRRAGMLRVYDMRELFDAVQTLSSELRRMGTLGAAEAMTGPGDRLAILSNGGGIGVLATDSLIEQGGQLAALSPATIERLNGCLPPTWSKANPVDIIGDAPGSRYSEALEALLEDDGADAVLVLNCPTAISDSMEAAEAVLKVAAGHKRPILTSWLGDGSAQPSRRRFVESRVPTYFTAEEAVRGFMHVVRYRRNQMNLMQVPAAKAEVAPDRDMVRGLIDRALAENRPWLSEVEAKQVLQAYGIPIARTEIARSPEQAEAAARGFSMGDLVAVKILSPDITHKSDVGGVVLNLTTPQQVREATAQMMERLSIEFPGARIDGVTVQQMVRRPKAHELIVGLNEDPQFGPVVLFGKGGKEVEIVGDTVTALPPLNDVLAQAVIEETAVYRLLKGYRDEPAVDFEAIRNALIQVSRIAADFAEIKELDINPLIADAQGVIALDARIRVAAATAAEADDPSARLAIRPYPRHLEGTVALQDGRQVAIRPIRPEDAGALQVLVARSDAQDIRFRFLHTMKDLPDRLAARLSQIDYAREMAFVAIDPDDDQAVIGVARLIADADGTQAEYSILLRKDHQGEGLGYAMMNRLIEFARARGIGLIYGDVLDENEPMLSMCADLGFKRAPHEDDASVQRVTLKLASDG